MDFRFWKKKSAEIDATTRTRIEALALLSGSLMGIALAELNAKRPFEVIVRHPERPQVRFFSHEDFAAMPEPDRLWGSCHVDDGRVTTTVTHNELELHLRAGLLETPDGFTFQEDFELGGTAFIAGAETILGEAIQASLALVFMPPSRLVLSGVEDLVASAERAMWAHSERLRATEVFINQDTGFASVTSDGHELERCTFTMVGSWSNARDSWLWGWANPSVDARFTEKLQEVRALGRTHSLGPLIEERHSGPQQDAQRLAALAGHVIGADCVTTIQISPTSLLYVALFDIKN